MDKRELIANKIMCSVQEKLGDGYAVTLSRILKNNSLALTGLIITKNGENVSPTIYIDDYIDSYEDASLEQITNTIIDTCFDAPTDFDISQFKDFNWVKGKIIYQFINTACNEELLKDIPYIPYLDLSIVFRVIIDINEDGGMASILIHNSHLEMWNVTTETVYKIAEENTPVLLPAKIISILDIIKKHHPEAVSLFDDYDFKHEVCPMYVLSNLRNLQGSICVKYPNILSDFAESTDSNLYVLPSSTHEVILVPDSRTQHTPEKLREMVRDVNSTSVSREEFLSDNIYFFSRKTQELTQI